MCFPICTKLAPVFSADRFARFIAAWNDESSPTILTRMSLATEHPRARRRLHHLNHLIQLERRQILHLVPPNQITTTHGHPETAGIPVVERIESGGVTSLPATRSPPTRGS